MNKAVFFDRDGTLNKTFVVSNKPYGPRHLKDIKLFKQVPFILNKLHELGFLIVVVSNQPDIALRKIDEKTRQALEKKFKNLVKIKKINIDAIYYCYHHPNSIDSKYPKNCDCRKPKPGMLLKASKELKINLKKSWIVGDTDKDIDAGKAAGCKTILIKKSYSGRCEPDFAVKSLMDIINIIKQ